MLYSSSYETVPEDAGAEPISIATFPQCSQLETTEQVCGFELLRLAFFALKLRKLNEQQAHGENDLDVLEYTFRQSLLRHVIFYQLVSLNALGARDQALQLINTCQ